MTTYDEYMNRYNKVQVQQDGEKATVRPMTHYGYPRGQCTHPGGRILDPHAFCEELATLYSVHSVINFEYPDKKYTRNWDIEIDNFDDLMRKARAFLREHFLKKEGEM